MKSTRLGSHFGSSPAAGVPTVGEVADADIADAEMETYEEEAAPDSFAVQRSQRAGSSTVSGLQLAHILGTAPRVETDAALEERVGEWLQSVARGETPSAASLQALREQVTAHGVLALVVVEGWEQAIAADLEPTARAAFHAAVARFLGDAA